MNLIKNLKALFATMHVQHERLSIWAMVAVIAAFSGQAQAANKVTRMICDFKAYFFEGELIWAIGGLALTAAGVWWFLDDDSKVKGKLLGVIAMMIFIFAVPEIITKMGGVSC